jgi:hypothetical protein
MRYAVSEQLNHCAVVELLQQFKEVDLMSLDDKETVKILIDAYITKAQISKLALS